MISRDVFDFVKLIFKTNYKLYTCDQVWKKCSKEASPFLSVAVQMICCHPKDSGITNGR